jgi:hypothetical protein
VLALMEDARQHGLNLAIATTMSPVNIAALLRRAIRATWRLAFPVICDASSAPLKKPHPQVLQRLGAQGGPCDLQGTLRSLRLRRARRINQGRSAGRHVASLRMS